MTNLGIDLQSFILCMMLLNNSIIYSFYSACSRYYSYNYNYYYNRNDWKCQGDQEAGTAVYVILLILMIAEFFVSMIAAIFCCQGGCCAVQQAAGMNKYYI